MVKGRVELLIRSAECGERYFGGSTPTLPIDLGGIARFLALGKSVLKCALRYP